MKIWKFIIKNWTYQLAKYVNLISPSITRTGLNWITIHKGLTDHNIRNITIRTHTNKWDGYRYASSNHNPHLHSVSGCVGLASSRGVGHVFRSCLDDDSCRSSKVGTLFFAFVICSVFDRVIQCEVKYLIDRERADRIESQRKSLKCLLLRHRAADGPTLV